MYKFSKNFIEKIRASNTNILFKLRYSSFNSQNNNNDDPILAENPINSKSVLRKKKPPIKKFNPPDNSMKYKIPEKEPEALNLKKFKHNKKLADLKKELKTFSEPPKIKEDYASTYYKLDLKKDFDLFDLRNVLYSYLFVRQRNGHIYLNINDFDCNVK